MAPAFLLLDGCGQLRVLPLTGSTVDSYGNGTALVLSVGSIITLGEDIGWRGFMLPIIR